MKRFIYLILAFLLVSMLILPACTPGTGAEGDNVYQGSTFANPGVPYVDASGTISTDAGLTYNAATDTLTIGQVTDSGLTSGRVPYAGAGGLLSDDAGLTYNAATDTLTAGAFIGDGSLLTGISATGSGVTSGTTLPVSPTEGQLFLHTPTGRNVLYQYENSTGTPLWFPIYSYGTTNIYVSKTGTDDQEHGTGTGTDAFLTINYALSQVAKNSDKSIVNIYVGAGTYTEDIQYEDYYGGALSIIGETSSSASLTATGGNQGSGSTAPQINGSFSAGDITNYTNKLVKFKSDTTTASLRGITRLAGLVTSTILYLVGDGLPATPVNGDTYDILSWDTIVDGHFWWINGPYSEQDLFYLKVTSSDSALGLIYAAMSFTRLHYCHIESNQKLCLNADQKSYIETYNCFINLTLTGDNYAISAGNFGQVDILNTKIYGYSSSQGRGANIGAAGQLFIASSDFSNFKYGMKIGISGYAYLLDQYIGGTAVDNFIHGCGTYGIWATQSSHVIYDSAGVITFGKKLNGTSDVNGLNTYTSDPGSWIGLNSPEYFTYQTWFDSLDGIDNTTGLGGSITDNVTAGYVSLLTAATTNSNAGLFKRCLYPSVANSWSKNSQFETSVYLSANTNQNLWIFCGYSTTNAHYGFVIDGNTIYGSTANGSSFTQSSSLGTFSAGATLRLKAIWDYTNQEVDFYVNEVYKDKIITTLPTGSNYTDVLMYIYGFATADEEKEFRISNWFYRREI